MIRRAWAWFLTRHLPLLVSPRQESVDPTAIALGMAATMEPTIFPWEKRR